MNKYRNKKVNVNGIVFDSKKEAERYRDLLLLERAGAITNLKRQVKYVLIPAQREPEVKDVRGKTKKGKLIEQECTYTADFTYFDKNGQFVVEDIKGMRTKDYIIKRKLMLFIHNIRIREV